MIRFLIVLLCLLFLGGMTAAGGIIYAFYHYGKGLPDYRQLADYEPPVMTRVYANDGRLIAEFATERRVFVPLQAMPRQVIDAFLSAEDKNFFSHPGVDFLSVVRAAVTNLRNYGTDRRPVGASTITQQVAKNFLLTSEVSIDRKIREAILAFRIEQAFSKEHILELYLNEIYLGRGSYGVAAAAMNYFNKSLDELTIAETAYLAALPKAPNNYHPVRQYSAAVGRRNWVIGRMLDDGRITPVEADMARAEPLVTHSRAETEFVRGADHFSEEIRRELQQRYGGNTLYQGGLAVRSSLDPVMQKTARRALRDGLIAYDRRRGWRGSLGSIDSGENWQSRLSAIDDPASLDDGWELAVVLAVTGQHADIGLKSGQGGRIPFSEMRWARRAAEGRGSAGPAPESPRAVVSPGDVIVVERLEENGEDFALRQIPEVEGSLVALDPHTGRILAMVGGFSYARSQFNRVTQAWRQPGSAFKPIIYAAALDNGYTPSSLVLDAPFVVDQGPGLPRWRPTNYESDRFYGPSTLRVGLETSRNLMTVRLSQAIGMETVVDYARRFGVVENMQPMLSMSLGAGETTLLRLTAAYAMMVNGGKRIHPTMIDRIQDRNGRTVFRHDERPCPDCRAMYWTQQAPPEVPDPRERVTDPMSAFQMVSILQGVVERGTGRSVNTLGRPVAGKTGTTNENMDAWFVGFTPDLAVGVFVGYDEPRSLGARETGGAVAAPIFRDFMAAALEDKPPTPFRIPPGIRLVRVNHATGELAQPGDRNVILEAFKPNTVPSGRTTVLGGGGATRTQGQGETIIPEAGGLY